MKYRNFLYGLKAFLDYGNVGEKNICILFLHDSFIRFLGRMISFHIILFGAYFVSRINLSALIRAFFIIIKVHVLAFHRVRTQNKK